MDSLKLAIKKYETEKFFNEAKLHYAHLHYYINEHIFQFDYPRNMYFKEGGLAFGPMGESIINRIVEMLKSIFHITKDTIPNIQKTLDVNAQKINDLEKRLDNIETKNKLNKILNEEKDSQVVKNIEKPIEENNHNEEKWEEFMADIFPEKFSKNDKKKDKSLSVDDIEKSIKCSKDFKNVIIGFDNIISHIYKWIYIIEKTMYCIKQLKKNPNNLDFIKKNTSYYYIIKFMLTGRSYDEDQFNYLQQIFEINISSFELEESFWIFKYNNPRIQKKSTMMNLQNLLESSKYNESMGCMDYIYYLLTTDDKQKEGLRAKALNQTIISINKKFEELPDNQYLRFLFNNIIVIWKQIESQENDDPVEILKSDNHQELINKLINIHKKFLEEPTEEELTEEEPKKEESKPEEKTENKEEKKEEPKQKPTEETRTSDLFRMTDNDNTFKYKPITDFPVTNQLNNERNAKKEKERNDQISKYREEIQNNLNKEEEARNKFREQLEDKFEQQGLPRKSRFDSYLTSTNILNNFKNSILKYMLFNEEALNDNESNNLENPQIYSKFIEILAKWQYNIYNLFINSSNIAIYATKLEESLNINFKQIATK